MTDPMRLHWLTTTAGQEHVLRGLEVAAVAGRNVMLCGPNVRGSLHQLAEALHLVTDLIDIRPEPLCPCGCYRAAQYVCDCSAATIAAYTRRRRRRAAAYPVRLVASLPLADELLGPRLTQGEPPETIAARIAAGQERARSQDPLDVGRLVEEERRLLYTACQQFAYGAFEVTTVLSLASAIIALDDMHVIDHTCALAEAVQYVPHFGKI